MTSTAPGSPANSGVTAARRERFAADLARLWPESLDRGARLGLAVSGGPDSLALLLLARAALPGRIEAATIDHGLRPESAVEAAMVAAACRDLGVRHEVIAVTVAPGNLQSRARSARYEALGRWLARRSLQAIATAHHADDQAETLLMRLNRGSGLAGLAGVRERGLVPGAEAALLRPLLSWRKTELAALVAAAGLAPVRDPSNEDPRFDRARLRAVLAQADWLDPMAIARSAALLGEAEQALAWAIGREWAEAVEPVGGGFCYWPHRSGAPGERRALVIGVVQRVLTTMSAHPRESETARLVDRLLGGGGGNLAGVQARAEGRGVEKGGAGIVWRFAPENPRR